MTASFRSKNIGRVVAAALAVAVLSSATAAQQPVPAPAQPATGQAAPQAVQSAPAPGPLPTDPAIPPGYVIGTDDILSIVFWKDKDMSADVQVRPDGKIALPLINEVMASGLTPDQLRQKLTEESKKYMEDANITVAVRQINSRRVFITGEVNKPGPYPLTATTSVLQLISMAGGLREYANSKKIIIMRSENGRQISLSFNYRDVTAGKNLKQNVDLKPGDTVVVP